MPARTMIQALFAHNDWARDKLLDAARPLSDDALDRPFEIGPGSLRATFYHLWAAEHVWLSRWLGNGDRSAVEARPTWSIAEMQEHFRSTAEARNAYVTELGDAGLATMISYIGPQDVAYTQPVGELMTHVCNHAAHHRAQALNMLRHVGVQPLMLDYLFMIREPTAPEPPAFDPTRLQRFFRYGDWANERVMAAAQTLDDAVLDRPVEMGLGSLRETLLHIQDAEFWWLQNWLGPTPDAFPRQPASTALAELRERTREIRAARDRVLRSSDAAGLRRRVVAKPRPDLELRFTVGDSMLQLFGHGTHHRAQAVNMLRHAGVAPPRLDYVVWVRETN